MELWLAAVLFVVAIAGLVALIVHTRQNGKKKWAITAIVVLCIVLLGILVYTALAFILLDAIR